MVYYIKAMAKGFTKRVALPIAFAATALTPALAGNTTLTIDQSFDRIAFDQTKTVELKMTSTGDNVSFVEVNVLLPEGLVYQEGTFKLADFLLDKKHTFKVEPIVGGFHATIYNDNLVSMGNLTDETICSFDVKANTKLTGESNIGLTIVDLVDENADQVAYQNVGDDSVEGTAGDNSIGSPTVLIDKSILPGEWNVYVTSENLVDGVLTIDPSKSLFTPQTISVNLKNTEAKIGALSFRLLLPQGLTLQEETVALNGERAVDKAVNYNVIKEAGVATNDYIIVVSGGLKALEGNDGVVVSFDVKADLSFCHTALDAVDPTFKDEIVLNEITVTDIYTTTVKQTDVKVTVYNPNEEAYYNLMNTVDGVYTLVENQANTDPFNRVYDYQAVFDARKEARDFIADKYAVGELGVQGNKETANTKVGTYKTTIEEKSEANEELHGNLVKEYTETYPAEVEALIPDGITSFPAAAPARALRASASDIAALTVADFIDPAVQEKYDDALAAIEAYGTLIEQLYNQKSEKNADKYDGALLADYEKGDAGQLAAAKEAVENAITTFSNKLNEVNEANNTALQNLLSGDLTDLVNEAKTYVEELENAETGTVKGAYANFENFPEIEAAIEAAETAIGELTTEDGALTTAYEAGTLPFEEGIKPVLDAIQGEGGILDLIENIKTVADQAKADNDAAYLQRQTEIQQILLDDRFSPSDEVLATETFQKAQEDFENLLTEYQELVEDENAAGTVAKHAAEIQVAKDALDEAFDKLVTVQDNLQLLNDLIATANDELQDAKDELQRLLDEYEFMEEGVYTEDLINDIREDIAAAEETLETLTDEINKDEDWTDLLNEEGEVDDWKAALEALIDSINGAEDDDIDRELENAEETYLKYHQLGDANMDGVVSTTDYVEIMNYVLGINTPMPADASEDQKVREKFSQLNVSKEDGDVRLNVTDAVALINLITYGDIHGAAPARLSDDNALLTAEESLNNGVRRIALNLSSAQSFVAGQFDVVLPEGMTIVGAQLSDRASRHTLSQNTLADGTVRFAITSQSNRAFNGNEGAVVYLEVEGNGDVQFQNVEFATANAYTHEFTVGAAVTTGIATTKVAAEGEQVYSLSGRVMDALKKGVNIIRRADGTTDKVIRK